MKRTALRSAFFGLLVGLASAAGCSPSVRSRQTEDQVWLIRTLTAQEAALSRAYDTCNLHRLRAELFAGTLIRLPDGRRIDPLTEAREQICGRLRREVVPDSLVARPVDDHSALVTGEQRFCTIGVNPCVGHTSRFATLWTLDRGTWRMSRMLRFPTHADH